MSCAFAIEIDRGDGFVDADIDLDEVGEVGLGRRDGLATVFELVAIASPEVLSVMGGVIGKSI